MPLGVLCMGRDPEDRFWSSVRGITAGHAGDPRHRLGVAEPIVRAVPGARGEGQEVDGGRDGCLADPFITGPEKVIYFRHLGAEDT